jgi:heme-degrading monooxygenase HmoA
MYARSTTVRGNPQSLDQAIRYMRDEVMPAVQQMDGCIGLSMICERDTGRCIATTAWQTEEAMHNSESGVHDMRMRMAQMMGDDSPQVQEWEIAMLHRMREAPEGACCRVVWASGDPADIDDRTSTFRTALLPRMEELPGFCSASAFVDRNSGRGVTATVYESREAMNRASAQGMSLREDFARQTNLQITEVAEMDLVLAHLRVPETV